ncbi:MAG TPA: CBS domain-containing protein [Nitrospiria bacterium]|nr:CBS domain-containing protein [Nitrospiria bacterium]
MGVISSMSLDQIMTRELQKVDSKTTIQDAARTMTGRKIGSIFIEEGGELIGILTEADIRKAVAKGMDMKNETVTTIMSKPIISVEVHQTPQQVFDLMSDAGVRHMAVRSGGNIVGLVSVRDLLVFFKKQSEPKMGID